MSISQDPWTLLGLDRNATAQEIKSAYARLIKIHRPNVDSEGFQRLRSAYVQMTQGGAGSAPTAPEAAPGPTPPVTSAEESERVESAPAPSAEPETPGLTEALNALAVSRERRIRRDIREALDAFDRVADAADLSMPSRGAALLSAFRARTSLLAEVCTRERLLQYVEGGDATLPHEVVTQWVEAKELRWLGELADALLAKDLVATTEPGAVLAIHVAAGLGAWNPERAQALLNPAFKALPADRRATLMKAADLEIQVGRVFINLPQDDKTFWLDLLRGKRKAPAWRDSTSRQLLGTVLRREGPNWAGFALLQRTLSRTEWNEMVAAIRALFHR